jgi:pimeloyl-ACP methyl ester carboxylesterase
MTSRTFANRRAIAILGFALLMGLALPGVGRAEAAPSAPDAPRDTPAADVPAILVHLPGIAGLRWIDREMLAGIKAGGYAGQVKSYDWTGDDPGLPALRNRLRNEREARVVARKIRGLLSAEPTARVTLVGHSGGTGIAVWALEELPEDVFIDSLVLLAPALSPAYDLSKALRHVRGKAYVFTSEHDAIVLGAGTTVFGTIDGVKTAAAGKVGFSRPEGADGEAYEKLVQMPYVARWMKFHNIGDHIGCMSRSFARHVIAPLLRGEAETAAEAQDEQARSYFRGRVRLRSGSSTTGKAADNDDAAGRAPGAAPKAEGARRGRAG